MAAETASWMTDLLRVVAPVTMLTFAINWFFSPSKDVYRRRIDSVHRDDRKWLKERFGRGSSFQIYRESIRIANSRVAMIFGRSWGIRSFRNCLAISFLYPFAFFICSWIISGEGFIGHLQVLPDGDFVFRIKISLLVLSVIFIPLVLILIIANRKFQSYGTRHKIAITTVSGLAFGSTLLLLHFYNLEINDNFMYLFVFSAWLLNAVLLLFINFDEELKIFYYVVFSVLTVSVFGLSIFRPETFGLSLVMFVLLPFINGISDWISWGFSRGMLIRATNHQNGYAGPILFVIDLFAVLIVGLISLIALTFTMANTISLANWLFLRVKLPVIDWISRLDQALLDPWGSGLAINGMLLTTLLPIFLAVVAGFSGLFFAWTPNVRHLSGQIPYDSTLKEQDKMSELFKDKLQGALLRARLWYVPATLLTLALFAGLFEAFSYTIQPYGHFLADVARCSTAWSHGQCSWGIPTPSVPLREVTLRVRVSGW